MLEDADAQQKQQIADTQRRRRGSDRRWKRRKKRVRSKQEQFTIMFLLTALGILVLLVFFSDSWPKIPQVGIE